MDYLKIDSSYGDFVYYMDVDEKAFYKMHLFNYEKEKVTDLDEDLLNFNLYNNYIYYSYMYLFRIDIKSNKIEKIRLKLSLIFFYEIF